MMSVSSPGAGDAFREHLGRAARANFYLRILFSLLLLVVAGFGPGLLFRLPLTGSFAVEPVAPFYAARTVIYAMLLVTLVCVLAVLCRRAVRLFEAEFLIDTAHPGSSDERARYLRLLRPSPSPFVLSGNVVIDLIIFGAALAAYSFWVMLLVETAPPDLTGHSAAGITLGSYGLFASLIITGVVWFGSSRRLKRLIAGQPSTGSEQRPAAP